VNACSAPAASHIHRSFLLEQEQQNQLDESVQVAHRTRAWVLGTWRDILDAASDEFLASEYQQANGDCVYRPWLPVTGV
jgi:hypothetical protein